MPITKKDNLQKLIKSLTKNEKKYFKESLKNDQNNNLYLKLFNLIDQESNPSQKQLKELFDNKANQLAVIKKYLTKLILRSLKILHQEELGLNQIANSILEINILLSKDLFDQAEAEIEKSIKYGRKTENLLFLLQTLDLKKDFLIKKYGPSSPQSQKTLQATIEEQTKILGQLYNLHQYQLLQANFYDQFHQSSGLTRTIYTTLHTNPLLTSEHSPESTFAQILQAEILYSLHIYKDQNYQAAFSVTNNIIKKLELRPEFIQENPEKYLGLLNQQLQLYLHLRNFTEIPTLLNKIRQSPHTFKFSLKQPNLLRTTLDTFQMELQLYTETKNFSAGRALIPDIQNAFSSLLSPTLKQWEVLLNYEIARFYLAEQNYSLCLQTLSQIEHSPHAQREPETLLQSLFLTCYLHLLQKNFLALKKKVNSIKKVFPPLRPLHIIEKQILQYFEDYAKNISHVKYHQRIQKELLNFQNHLEKRENIMLSELVNWLEQAFLLQSTTIDQK